jgi:hypothetical protein
MLNEQPTIGALYERMAPQNDELLQQGLTHARVSNIEGDTVIFTPVGKEGLRGAPGARLLVQHFINSYRKVLPGKLGKP